MRISTLLTMALVLAVVGCGSGGGDDTDAAADTITDTVADSADTGVDVPGDTVGESECECAVDGDCDDSDPCTADTCDTDLGLCVNEAVDADGDGYTAQEVDSTACGGTDCDDADGDIHPDADLDCTGGGDFDCDGMMDSDEDGDGYTTVECAGGDDCDDGDEDAFPGSTADECADVDLDCNDRPENDEDGDGHVSDACTGGDDCDDTDPDVYTGAVEDTCNGIDDDCNGELMDTEDGDGDGYANADCAAAGAEVDCDDTSESTYPGAEELCDMQDRDCDGSLLDAPGIDDDSDGVPDAECGGPDCDDTDGDIHGAYLTSGAITDTAVTEAEEICDAIDQDCDGSVLDAIGADSDGDGHLDAECGGDDCDDLDVTVFPGAPTDCGADHDCDTISDDDSDEDGHVSVGCGGDDCDDTVATIYPGADEVCNDGVDQDCDGSADGLTMLYGGTKVPDSGVQSTSPDMVWADGEFGVVWYETSPGDPAVHFRRVSADATLLGSELIPSHHSTGAVFPAISWSESEYGVVWQNLEFSSIQVFLSRVDASGAETGSFVQITSGAGNHQYGDITWSGSEYGVVWDRGNISFGRFEPDGTPISSTVPAFDTWGTTSPLTVWTGSQYGVAYGYPVSGDDQVYFGRLSSAGSVLGSVVHVTSGGGDKRNYDLAWNGSIFGLTWADNRSGQWEIYFQRLTAGGSPVGGNLAVTDVSVYANDPSIAWDASLFTLAWSDSRSGTSELFLVQITDAGMMLGTEMALTGHGASRPILAWTGSTHGIVYFDDESGASQIYFDIIDHCE